MIHAVTIPFEWISWLLLLAVVDLNWWVAGFCSFYYLCIGSKISKTASVAQIMFSFVASRIYLQVGTFRLILVALLVQLLSWFAQVYIGHYLIEKNRPAMATKLTVNSVILSPMMAWDY